MTGKSKQKVLILIIIFLSFAVSYSSLKVYENSNHKKSYKSKIIEYEYLRRIVNNSKGNLEYFTVNFGDALQHRENGTYIIDADDIISNEFFIDQKYIKGISDFYGYEFHFNENGQLNSFYFYKP